jgi:hypothetical protein
MNWMKRLSERLSRTTKQPCWPLGMPELTVEELRQSRERGLELRLRHPVFAMLADDLAKMLDDLGAVNYVEYTVCSDKYGPMRVCVQRLEGETPAMQNERLRKRVAELEAKEIFLTMREAKGAK